MFKCSLVFVIFMMAKWQLFAVEADDEAEWAILTSSNNDTNRWRMDINLPEDDTYKKCRELIIESRRTELSVDKANKYRLRVDFEIYESEPKSVWVLVCGTTDDDNVKYMFTGGAHETVVTVESKYYNEDHPNYVFGQVLAKDYIRWEYIYEMAYLDRLKMDVCQKIFNAHHDNPYYEYRVIGAFRALRNGETDPINNTTTMFTTLLCYYTPNDYFEYCEGSNESQVFQVMCSGDVYMPMWNLPIEVDYQI